MCLHDTARDFLPVFPGSSSLSPLIHRLITSRWPINMSHFGLSGSNFCTSRNIISWGENGVGVWEKRSAAGNVQESFICLFLFFLHLRPPFFSPTPPCCLFLHRIDPSALGRWKSSLTAVCSCFPSQATIVACLKRQEKAPKSIYPCRLSRWLPLMAGVQILCSCW